MIPLDSYAVPNPAVVGRLVEGEAVLVLPQQGQVKVLNEVGARVWVLADGARTLRQIAAALCDEYDVSQAQAEADVSDFVAQLAERGIVRTESARPCPKWASWIALFLILALLLPSSAMPVEAVVTLVGFTASPSDGQVLLEWETASEIDNAGFFLHRSTAEAGEYIRIGPFFPSEGDGIRGDSYDYLDQDVQNGTTYYYKLESVATDGSNDFDGPILAIPGAQPTATRTATPTATGTATATATATLTPPPTATLTATRTPTMTPTPLPTATSPPTTTATATPPTLPTATSIPTMTPSLPTAKSTPATPYPPLPTATSTPATPYLPLPTATAPPRPTSTPTSTPAATPTRTPMAVSLPTSTPAATEISSPTSTAATTRIAIVTLSPTPSGDTTSTSDSAETSASPSTTPSVLGPEAQGLRTGSVEPHTVEASDFGELNQAAAPQPPTATVTPAAIPVALPISRDPAGLGHLWLVGILLVAFGAGVAWLAYSFIRHP